MTVLVQTRIPDHEVIAAAVRGDPGLLVDRELELREQLRLPPASALALLSGELAEAYGRAVAAWAGAAHGPEAGNGTSPGVAVSGLGDGRWLVRAGDERTLCDALAGVARPAGPLKVVVDPTDI